MTGTGTGGHGRRRAGKGGAVALNAAAAPNGAAALNGAAAGRVQRGPASGPDLRNEPLGRFRIELADTLAYRAALDDLAALLVDAVDSGASVNFLAALELTDARAWWLARENSVAEGAIIPFLARSGGSVIGVVLLILAMTQNGAHRAEVAKLIVNRRARGRGVATALLEAAERHAKAIDRWLLVLDTETDSPADALYRSRGWQVTGVVPAFARQTDGALRDATLFWKDLRAVPSTVAKAVAGDA